MNAIAIKANRFQGLSQIVRFNWTFYALALTASAAAIALARELPHLRPLLLIGVGVALYFVLATLVASFWIYDCSRLGKWNWIAGELPGPPARWLNLHCGLDESTLALRQIFPNTAGRAFDIFDQAEMTEPSITRARSLARPAIAAEPVRYDALPVESNTIDAAFLLLSAHELRHHAARVAFFRELHRALRPDGRIILAEHLRDPANFLAFGPGFFHFHAAAAWRRAARDAGLAIDREFRITPFIAVFNLKETLMITTLVRVAGIFMLLLVPLNVLDVPKRFHWKQELAGVSLLNRQIFQVHAAFICLVLAMFGLLATLMTRPLLEPTPLARAIVAGLAVFWLLRLLAQLFVYDPRIWRGNRFYTRMHYLFLALWMFLTGTFALALTHTLFSV